MMYKIREKQIVHILMGSKSYLTIPLRERYAPRNSHIPYKTIITIIRETAVISSRQESVMALPFCLGFVQ